MSSGREWTPAFEGQRPPFGPGNQVSVGNRGAPTHGAYSTALSSSPRVLELCDELRMVAPWLQPADEVMLRVFVTGVVQFEAASSVRLPAPGATDDDLEAWAARVERHVTLSRDQRGWMRDLMKAGHELGLTPAGRAEMEEREQTTMLVADAQALFTGLFLALGTFVPAEHREAFLERLDDVRASFPIERPALEAGSSDGA